MWISAPAFCNPQEINPRSPLPRLRNPCENNPHLHPKTKNPAFAGFFCKKQVPVSRILYPPESESLSFISNADRSAPLTTYPPGLDGQPLLRPKPKAPVYMVFQPMRFAKLRTLPRTLVGSYSTFSPFPQNEFGVVSLSVALSVSRASPLACLPVRKHGTLRCPDFPHPPKRTR